MQRMFYGALVVLFGAVAVACDADDPAGNGDIGDAATGGEEVMVPPGLVRFIHVADLHYAGTMADEQRDYIAARVDRLNALDFPADRVVITGDIIDYLPAELDENNITDILVDELDKLDAPWLPAIGNHEFYDEFHGTSLIITEDKATREEVFSAAMGYPLWFAEMINGVRLVILHSMDGPTWNRNAGLLGSFGAEQLAWLDQELSDGRPSFLFFHHPPNTLVQAPGAPSLCDVVEAHPGVVKGIFTGHLHGFFEQRACGVPSFIVGNWLDDDMSHYLVEYDGALDELLIVNRDELPFPALPEYECQPDPAFVPAIAEAAVDTVQLLLTRDVATDAQDGVGQYLGDGLGQLPFVIRVDGGEAHVLAVRLSMAGGWGTDDDEPFTYLDGAMCLPLDFSLMDDCFEAGPVNFQVDLLQHVLRAALEITIAPDWQARLDVNDFHLQGRLAEVDGETVIAEGIIYASVNLETTRDDLERMLVREYCEERISNCIPGADMPACPPDWSQPSFDFQDLSAQIPRHCDVWVETFSLRMILALVESTSSQVQLSGMLSSAVLDQSRIDADVFVAEPDYNCAAVPPAN